MPSPRKRDYLRLALRRIRRPGSSAGDAPVSPEPPTTVTAATSQVIIAEPRGRAAFEAALQELDRPDRDVIVRNVGVGAVGDIDEAIRRAYEAARSKRDLCEREMWEWRLGGRVVVLRDEAEKVLRWLDRFRAVGDVVANVDPLHVGLPWAGIRMVLEVTVMDYRQTAALITGMSLVLGTVDRLRVYWAYLNRLAASPAAVNFEKALIKLFAQVLRFIAKAIQMHEKNFVQRVSGALWASADLEDFEVVCDKLAHRTEIEASNCDREVHHQDWHDLQLALERINREQGRFGEKIQSSMAQISVKAELRDLGTVEDAIYNSHADEDLVRCLEGTRTDILSHISDWAMDPGGKSIFWLRGMAGTGKSTILRTAAFHLDRVQRRLGASFFFKKGEGDRGNAKRFIPTIAVQLAARIPGLDQAITKILDLEPFAAAQSLRDQFDKLIVGPLLDLDSTKGSGPPALVVVIDALDECDRITDIRKIIALFGLVGSKTGLRLRVLVASRPEVSIVAGLEELDTDLHEDMVLEEVQTPSIEHDIRLYLQQKFTDIRRQDKADHPYDPIPDPWPNKDDFEALVNLAMPLFIFAATVYRFVSSRNPQHRLATLLQQQRRYALSGLEAVYLPILNQLIVGCDRSERESIIDHFRKIVGPIVLLAEPLPARSLARLLDLHIRDVDDTLRNLHSVLQIPKNPIDSIRLFHLSFRNFLVRGNGQSCHDFLIDPAETHQSLWYHCIHLLSRSLKRDLCGVKDPGTERHSVRNVSDHITVDVAYACRNWICHVTEWLIHFPEDQTVALRSGCPILNFLQTHLLHWIEAMTWLGRVSEALLQLEQLGTALLRESHSKLDSFIVDAGRFLQRNLAILDDTPLQLYVSAILFAPKSSIVKATFEHSLLLPLSYMPSGEDDWGTELQVFEGADSAIDFSPDGRLFAYSHQRTLRLWDIKKSESVRSVQFAAEIQAIKFIPNSGHISVTTDQELTVWDMAADTKLESFAASHVDGGVLRTQVTSDGSHIVNSYRDGSFQARHAKTGQRLWHCFSLRTDVDVTSHTGDGMIAVYVPYHLESGRAQCHMLPVVTGKVARSLQLPVALRGTVAAFSPNQRSFATFHEGSQKLSIVDMTSLEVKQEKHIDYKIQALAYSSNGHFIAMAGAGCVGILDVGTGDFVGHFRGHMSRHRITALQFSSSDGLIVATACDDGTIRLWDAAALVAFSPGLRDGGIKVPKEVHGGRVIKLAFDPHGEKLVSVSDNGSGTVWDANTGNSSRVLWPPQATEIDWMYFLPDGQKILTASRLSAELQLRDVYTGETVKSATLQRCCTWVARVTPPSGGNIIIVHGVFGHVHFLDAASLTEVKVISSGRDNTLHIEWSDRWHPSEIGHVKTKTHGELEADDEQTNHGRVMSHSESIGLETESILVSSDRRLVAVEVPRHTINIIATDTNEILQTLEAKAGTDGVSSIMAFSRHASFLAVSVTNGPTHSGILLWQRSTGEVRRQFVVSRTRFTAMAIDDGDQHLAFATIDGLIQVHDLCTGTAVLRIGGFGHLDSLVFSKDSRYLTTNWGRLATMPDQGDSEEDETGAEIFRTKDWIRRKGQNMIRIPPHLRGSNNWVHGYSFDDFPTVWTDNAIAFGQPSGSVAIIKFED